MRPRLVKIRMEQDFTRRDPFGFTVWAEGIQHEVWSATAQESARTASDILRRAIVSGAVTALDGLAYQIDAVKAALDPLGTNDKAYYAALRAEPSPARA